MSNLVLEGTNNLFLVFSNAPYPKQGEKNCNANEHTSHGNGKDSGAAGRLNAKCLQNRTACRSSKCSSSYDRDDEI